MHKWVYNRMENAKSSLNYIKNGIAKMNDPCRSDRKLNDFKERVENAKDDYDSI